MACLTAMMSLGFYSLSVLFSWNISYLIMSSLLCRTQMPKYRFMVTPCTLGLWKDMIPDLSSRMFRRCWRKLWHPGRPYTGSVPSNLDSEFRNSEMSTQSERPLHTPVMVKEVLQFLDIKPGQVSQFFIRSQRSLKLSVYVDYTCVSNSLWGHICVICILDVYTQSVIVEPEAIIKV